jgi:disulfide bond formation protein DsbB
MTTERSDKVYENWRQAAERFDYFVLGVTGALCAYLSQSYKPVKLGCNPSSLELVTLLLFVLAAIAGFRRIEQVIYANLLNHILLWRNEQRGDLVTKAVGEPLVNKASGEILAPHHIAARVAELSKDMPALQANIEKVGRSSQSWYKLRNWLILLGFVVLVYAKVWSAYV